MEGLEGTKDRSALCVKRAIMAGGMDMAWLVLPSSRDLG